MFRSLLILSFISLIAISGMTARADDAVDFPNQFEQLAAKCDELKLPQQATITRQWIVTQRRDQRVVYPFQTAPAFQNRNTLNLVSRRFVMVHVSRVTTLEVALCLRKSMKVYIDFHTPTLPWY